jgi:hypothetical protein
MRYLHWLVPALLTAGCALWSQDIYHDVSQPPSGPAAAVEQWWDGYVCGNPTFLAVLLEASETHRRNGSSATYEHSFTGCTMAARHHCCTRLPLPMPAAVAEKARQRLGGINLQELDAGWQIDSFGKSPVDMVGCSKEEAVAIWHNAARKYGYREPGEEPREKPAGGLPGTAAEAAPSPPALDADVGAGRPPLGASAPR